MAATKINLTKNACALLMLTCKGSFLRKFIIRRFPNMKISRSTVLLSLTQNNRDIEYCILHNRIYPSIWRNLSSFSILDDADVGMRCLIANLSSGTPFTDAMYTELKVPTYSYMHSRSVIEL